MTILIIDDSRVMRALVQRALVEAGHASATFLEACTGREGVRLAGEAEPDLICCDLHLPDLSGFDVLRAWRRTAAGQRFGFITSDSAPETQERALAAGADFFLNKPFTAEAVAAAVQPPLAETQAAPCVKEALGGARATRSTGIAAETGAG